MSREEFIDRTVTALVAADGSGELAEPTQLVMIDVMSRLASDAEFVARARIASRKVFRRAHEVAAEESLEAAVVDVFTAGVARGVAAATAAHEGTPRGRLD